VTKIPRRRPRNLDAFRFELGTLERDLLRDRNMIDGLRAAALPLSAGLLGLGLAAAGFLAYNKVDDLKDWVADQWSDGFGLVNDPEQTQEQVGSFVESGPRTPKQFSGMSVHSIYDIHYNMRDDLCQYFSRMWCEFEGKEWNGENHEFFLQYYWSTSWLGTGQPMTPTYRFERNEVLQHRRRRREQNLGICLPDDYSRNGFEKHPSARNIGGLGGNVYWNRAGVL
jgi:hypothetical protein